MNVFENNIVELNDGKMDENRESFNVLHCDECHNAYEMEGPTIVYHIDFPSYGLERKTCLNCN